MKKMTVTIGIAAHNEEKNIASLLVSLLSQKLTDASLQNIIVVSDGSTDMTISEVKKLKNKKIIVFDTKKRFGKAEALNRIIRKVSSDVLVFMDADVMISDKRFLQKLLTPIRERNIDLATAKVMELPTKNEFQNMLLLSMDIKKDIFEMYNSGENIYTCHGRSLALHKNVYKKLQFPKKLIADDAYIYLFCKTNGFSYQYVKEAKVYYALPQNLEDHKKQSHRFLSSQKQLYTMFGEKVTKGEYHLPLSIIVKSVIRNIFKNPILLVQYVVVFAKSKIQSLMQQPTLVHWETAHSSKTL